MQHPIALRARRPRRVASSSSRRKRTSSRSVSTGASSRSAHSESVTPVSWRSSSRPPSRASAAPASRYRSWWYRASRPWYSAMSVKLGLVTVSRTPRPVANPFANWVLPAPRGPGARSGRPAAPPRRARTPVTAWRQRTSSGSCMPRCTDDRMCPAVVIGTGSRPAAPGRRARPAAGPQGHRRWRRMPRGPRVGTRHPDAGPARPGPRAGPTRPAPSPAATRTASAGQSEVGSVAGSPPTTASRASGRMPTESLVRRRGRQQVPGMRRDGSPAEPVEGQDRERCQGVHRSPLPLVGLLHLLQLAADDATADDARDADGARPRQRLDVQSGSGHQDAPGRADVHGPRAQLRVRGRHRQDRPGPRPAAPRRPDRAGRHRWHAAVMWPAVTSWTTPSMGEMMGIGARARTTRATRSAPTYSR